MQSLRGFTYTLVQRLYQGCDVWWKINGSYVTIFANFPEEDGMDHCVVTEVHFEGHFSETVADMEHSYFPPCFKNISSHPSRSLVKIIYW